MIRHVSVTHVLFELWITNTNQLTGHLGRITLHSLNAHIMRGQTWRLKGIWYCICVTVIFFYFCVHDKMYSRLIFSSSFEDWTHAATDVVFVSLAVILWYSQTGLCGAQWSWTVLKLTGRTREILCLGRALAALCLQPLYLGTTDWLWFLFLRCCVIRPGARLGTISVSHSFGQYYGSSGDFYLAFDNLFNMFGIIIM